MRLLVLTEFRGKNVESCTLEILGKLTGQLVDIVTMEVPSDFAMADLTRFGAVNIHCLQHQGLPIAHCRESYFLALSEFLTQHKYDYLITGVTSFSSEIFARLAGKFAAPLATDVIDWKWENNQFVGVRSIYGGKCLAEVVFSGQGLKLVTVRSHSLGATDLPQMAGGEIVLHPLTFRLPAIFPVLLEYINASSSKIELADASIIIAGGRGMKSKENFQLLEMFAQTVNGAVGASRAAVEAGFAHSSMQIGQTGITVSPTIYIACGISGSIQHFAGIRNSKIIIAINIDPQAPIFKYADYGIVGDLFTIVPIMIEEFKRILL